ncbi:MAG: hypothetical protein NQU42_05140 [Methanothrix sp.]|uniref:hypothetical protein n=1 Tax=Methanothrix sp. TaxID=90426 RepID=UPI0025FD23BC|nr:hypothetical protein [Methanothrix sp.]MCQ8903459.1 hypothetical protein [Methanothrix sp.]
MSCRSPSLVPKPLIRSAEADKRLELFMVTSVATILCIRFVLHATGYPQLAIRGLHIAHVLLGGALMVLSIVILLAFIDRYSSDLAAVVGGIGFGAFIDELGKFVTMDNNYFFQPTVALIYITFVLLYIFSQMINGEQLTHEECLLNALELVKDAVIKDLDIQERKRALELLDGCDPSDPLVKVFKDMLAGMECIQTPDPGIYTRCREGARRVYHWLVSRRWFVNAVIAFFIIQSVVTLFEAALLVMIKLADSFLQLRLISISMASWLELLAATVSSILVLSGVLMIRRNRLAAYYRFKNAMLVQILLVQTFAFYRDQLSALTALAINIVILLTLRYMIAQESSADSADVLRSLS